MPQVDRYGQLIAANYAGKLVSDADLDPDAVRETEQLARIGTPVGFDRYGGRTDLGWKSRSTGYFRVETRRGVWWLITPLGNPCFYTSVSAVPSVDWDGTPVTGRDGLFSGLPDSSGRFASAWKKDMWGENQGNGLFLVSDLRTSSADFPAIGAPGKPNSVERGWRRWASPELNNTQR